MKRFNWVAKSILVVFLIISLSACQQHDIGNNSSVSSQVEQTEESSSVVSDEKATENAEEEKLTEVQLLDKELRERLLEIYSNADTVNTIAEYSDKMEALIEKYNGLMRSFVPESGPKDSVYEHFQDDIPSAFEENCKAWEEYSKVALSTREQFLEGIYMNGSTMPIAYARYEYDLYHARAEELYELCYRLHLI